MVGGLGMIDDMDATQMMAKKLNGTSLLKNFKQAPAGSGMADSGSGMASSSSASGVAAGLALLGTSVNLTKLFGPGRDTGTRTKGELNEDFAVQIKSLKLAGFKIGMINSQLLEAKDLGFNPKRFVALKEDWASKGDEMTTIDNTFQKFVENLTPREKASLLDISSHFGKYATDCMKAFKPLFDDLETLIAELKGKTIVHCTINKLRYPSWNPKWNTQGCIPHCWENV